MLWLACGLTIVATVCDLRRREIPDWIPAVLGLCAVIFVALGWTDVGWVGLGLGCVAAFVPALLLFALGALGGGDVKLLAVLGMGLGPAAMLSLLFWMAIAGGVFAVIAAARQPDAGETNGRPEIAYAPAILAGVLVQVWNSAEVTHALFAN